MPMRALIVMADRDCGGSAGLWSLWIDSGGFGTRFLEVLMMWRGIGFGDC